MPAVALSRAARSLARNVAVFSLWGVGYPISLFFFAVLGSTSLFGMRASHQWRTAGPYQAVVVIKQKEMKEETESKEEKEEKKEEEKREQDRHAADQAAACCACALLTAASLSRAARSLARNVAVFSLWGVGYPISLFFFAVLGSASLFGMRSSHQWRTAVRRHWRLCAVDAALLVGSLLLLYHGIPACGVARAVLLADYGDAAISACLRALFSRQSSHTNVGLACVLGSLGLLLFIDIPSFAAGSSGFLLLVVGALTALRRSVTASAIGKGAAPGVERGVRTTSYMLAAAFLAPTALWSFLTRPVMFFYPGPLFSVIVVSAATIFETEVDSASKHQMSEQLWTQSGLAAAFLTGCFFDNFIGVGNVGVSFLSLVSFGLMLVGLQTLGSIESAKQSDLDLPLVSGGQMPSRTSLARAGSTTATLLRNGIRQILEHTKSRRLFAFLCVNLMFMFIEIIWGAWTNSLGLISDGCHMLFDCIALAIGLAAAVISKWEANQNFSYGYGRMQVLSGFVNGVLLVFIAFFVCIESLHRFFDEAEMKTERLFLVSFLGFLVNLFGVFAFHQHGGEECDHHHHCHDHEHCHEHDHKPESIKQARRNKWSEKRKGSKHKHRDDNMHGVFLHVLADTLGSVGVIISSLLVEYYGLHIADPICSLCISVLIFVSVIPLLTTSAKVLLQCTPPAVLEDLPAIAQKIMTVDGVSACREIHVWKHSSALMIGTVSVNLRDDANEQRVLSMIQSILRESGVTNPCIECVKENSNAVYYTAVPPTIPVPQ
eukprot:m51a1_g2101 putative zinc transporter 5 (774) ;mRNA; r:1590816-1595155